MRNNTIIVISGSSGSGKTTISRKLYFTLSTCGLDAVYREWENNPDDYFLLKIPLKLLIKFFPRIHKSNLERLVQGPKNNKFPLRFKIWPFFIWLDRLAEIFYLRFFKPHNVTVIHRYIHGVLIALLGYYGWGKNELIDKLYFPKPDIFIMLDTTPEEVMKRGADYPTLKDAEYWRKNFLNIADKNGYPIVDSSYDVETTFRNCLRVIVSRMMKNQEDMVLHLLSDPYNYYDRELLERIDFRKLDYNYLYSYVLELGIGFQALGSLLEYDIPEIWRNKFSNKLLELENYSRKVSSAIKEIHNLFKQNNIKYVMFKTNRPYKHVSRDIDILVDDYKKAFSVLKKDGWVTDLEQILLSEVHLKKGNIVLDLHDKIERLPKKLLLENVIKNKEEINIPKPELEVLSILLECIEDLQMDLEDIHYIRGLVKENDINWKEVYNLSKVLGVYKKINQLLSIVRLKDIFYYSGKLSRKLPEIKDSGIDFQKSLISLVYQFRLAKVKKRLLFLKLAIRRLISSPFKTIRAGFKRYIFRR